MLPVPCPRCANYTLVVHDDVCCPFSCRNCGHELRPTPDEVPLVIEFLANWNLARLIVGGTVEFCGHTLELNQEQQGLELLLDGEIVVAEEECPDHWDGATQ